MPSDTSSEKDDFLFQKLVLLLEKLAAQMGVVSTYTDSMVGSYTSQKESLRQKADIRADETIVTQYNNLVSEIHALRKGDTYLEDKAWDWIWKGKDEYTCVQIYGRIAWINYEFLNML